MVCPAIARNPPFGGSTSTPPSRGLVAAAGSSSARRQEASGASSPMMSSGLKGLIGSRGAWTRLLWFLAAWQRPPLGEAILAQFLVEAVRPDPFSLPVDLFWRRPELAKHAFRHREG